MHNTLDEQRKLLRRVRKELNELSATEIDLTELTPREEDNTIDKLKEDIGIKENLEETLVLITT